MLRAGHSGLARSLKAGTVERKEKKKTNKTGKECWGEKIACLKMLEGQRKQESSHPNLTIRKEPEVSGQPVV